MFRAIDWIVAETRHVGVEFKEVRGLDWTDEQGSFLKDSTISAYTSYSTEEFGHKSGDEKTGLIMPAGSGCSVQNVDMIGWGKSGKSKALGGTNIICRVQEGAGGYEWRFSDISWYDCPVRIGSRWTSEIRVVDMDGSFTAPDKKDSSLVGTVSG